MSRHQKNCGNATRRRRRPALGDDPSKPERELTRLGYELGLDLYDKDPESGLYHCKECNHKVNFATTHTMYLIIRRGIPMLKPFYYLF